MHQDQEDQELINRCLAGDAAAWDEMSKRIRPLVARLAAGLDDALQEDLVQETRINLSSNGYRVLRQFRGNNSLDPLLSVIVRRRLADHFRTAYQKPTGVSLEEWIEHHDLPDPQGGAVTDLWMAVEQTLTSTEIFTLRLDMAGYTSEELASILSHFFNKPLTREAVRKRLERIREKLRRAIPGLP